MIVTGSRRSSRKPVRSLRHSALHQSNPRETQSQLQRQKRSEPMRRNSWCVALSLLLVGGSSASGEILRGVMAINGAEMR